MSTNVEDFPRMKEFFPRILNSIFISYPSSTSVKNQEHDVTIYILDTDVFSSGTLEDESSREQSLQSVSQTDNKIILSRSARTWNK